MDTIGEYVYARRRKQWGQMNIYACIFTDERSKYLIFA